MKRKVYGETTKFVFVRDVCPEGKYRYAVKSLRWLPSDEVTRMFQVLPQDQWQGSVAYFNKHADAKRVFIALVLIV